MDELTTQAPDLTQPTRSVGGVVTVDDQKYAVGLMWQPVQNIDDPDPEIRETMESEPDADLYCLRLPVPSSDTTFSLAILSSSSASSGF